MWEIAVRMRAVLTRSDVIGKNRVGSYNGSVEKNGIAMKMLLSGESFKRMELTNVRLLLTFNDSVGTINYGLNSPFLGFVSLSWADGGVL